MGPTVCSLLRRRCGRIAEPKLLNLVPAWFPLFQL